MPRAQRALPAGRRASPHARPGPRDAVQLAGAGPRRSNDARALRGDAGCFRSRRCPAARLRHRGRSRSEGGRRDCRECAAPRPRRASRLRADARGAWSGRRGATTSSSRSALRRRSVGVAAAGLRRAACSRRRGVCGGRPPASAVAGPGARRSGRAAGRWYYHLLPPRARELGARAPSRHSPCSRSSTPVRSTPSPAGHEDLVRRAAAALRPVVVGVAASESKRPFFGVEERVSMAGRCSRRIPNVDGDELSTRC